MPGHQCPAGLGAWLTPKIERVDGAQATCLQSKDTFLLVSGILTLFLVLTNELWVHPKENANSFIFSPPISQLPASLQFGSLRVACNFSILPEYYLLL